MIDNPIRGAFESIDSDAVEEFREALRARCLADLNSGDAGNGTRPGRTPVGEQFIPMKEMSMSIDSSTARSRNRHPFMAAAAAVVVIGIAGIALAAKDTDDQSPSPAAAAPASTAPTTTITPKMETVHLNVAHETIPVTLTAPDNWTVDEGWTVYQSDLKAGVLFDEIGGIYSDGCGWVPVDPPVGPTVDDLVAAWATVPELAATAAVDVTVDGYTGKQFDLTVPDYPLEECRGRQFGLYRAPGVTGDSPDYWAQGPNQQLQMWVLDVDGTRLVIGASTFPSTSPHSRATLEELLASIQIG